MAILNFNPIPSLPVLDMVATGPLLPGLFNGYDRAELSSTRIELSNDASNQTVFSGTGITYTTIAGKLVITGGEITDIVIRAGGTNVATITNATLDAGDLGDLLASGPSSKFWDFFLQGNDTVNGNTGNDVLTGFAGNDTLNGLNGNDTLNGGNGNDILNGGAGNDQLFGDAGDDMLNGGAGDDYLRGGQGINQATGGAGADDFVFFAVDGKMAIQDFEPGVDDLVFSGLGAGFTIVNLIPFVSQVGDDVVIAAGAQEVRFIDTQLSSLSVGDVVFV
jgi:Ca2+-binding RTX toxin-like protein